MIVAIDNDIIEKCAFFGLLDRLHELLGCDRTELRVLSTAKYRYGDKKPLQAARRYGSTLAGEMLAFCRGVAEVDQANDEDNTALQGVDGIDVGEVMLVSFVSRTEGSLLATDDKRALRALASAPRGAQIAARLRGRVLCAEVLLSRALRRCGFEETRRIVSAGMARPRENPDVRVDAVVGVCFGSGMLAVEATVEATLADYRLRLRESSAGPLCMWEGDEVTAPKGGSAKGS